jgi:hypothetical protein
MSATEYLRQLAHKCAAAADGPSIDDVLDVGIFQQSDEGFERPSRMSDGKKRIC